MGGSVFIFYFLFYIWEDLTRAELPSEVDAKSVVERVVTCARFKHKQKIQARSRVSGTVILMRVSAETALPKRADGRMCVCTICTGWCSTVV